MSGSASYIGPVNQLQLLGRELGHPPRHAVVGARLQEQQPVANVGDVRSELAQAKSSGKNSVLLQVKSQEATRFVAVPLA